MQAIHYSDWKKKIYFRADDTTQMRFYFQLSHTHSSTALSGMREECLFPLDAT